MPKKMNGGAQPLVKNRDSPSLILQKMENTSLDQSPDSPKKKPPADKAIKPALREILSTQIPILPDGSLSVHLGSGTITSILGQGGAAIVYEVWVEKLGIARAVKLLKPDASIESASRFETEMRITAQLRHPNIIEIHNVGEWNGLPYIEMEKIDGMSLDALIRERGGLPLTIGASIAILVCRALNATHNHVYLVNNKKHVGILHRDLKPGNIMISKSGMVKLMDFGIATPTDVSMHTMEGTVVGSMQYIAPELLEGKKNNSARTDIFSFGCVLYEMITGQKAFSEKNMAKLMSLRMKNSYKPLSEFAVKCPRQLAALVNSCLTLNPNKRISTAKEILSRLEKIHAKMSKSNPEDLVGFFVNSRREKSIIAFKRAFSAKAFAVVCCAAALAVIATYFGFVAGPDHFQKATKAFGGSPRAGAPATNDKFAPKQSPNPGAKTAKIDPRFLLPSGKTSGEPDSRTTSEIKSSQIGDILSSGVKGKALVVSLQKQYGTKNLLAILSNETDKKNYANTLTVFDALDKESAATVKARLYKLRALLGLNNKEALAAFFLRPDLPDKEYYVAKAQHLAVLKQYGEAADLCDKSRQAQAILGDAAALDLNSVYVKASCLTGNFMVSATQESRKKALDSWFEVKRRLRNDPLHPFFVLANKNILLLSDQSKKTGL
jgi:serine/threonine protein kinase